MLGILARVLGRGADAASDSNRIIDAYLDGSRYDIATRNTTTETGQRAADNAAPNPRVDEVLGLPAPNAVGSARRSEPGVASHGGSLPRIEAGQPWLRGTDANAGKVPAQIAEELSGRNFRNFDHFRQEFWMAVSRDPVLNSQFSTSNQALIRNGGAPFSTSGQQVGGRKRFELDHVQELQNGGNVFDMNNIVIRTPFNHIKKGPNGG